MTTIPVQICGDHWLNPQEGLPRWRAMREQIYLLAARADFPQLLVEISDIIAHNQQRAQDIGHSYGPQ